MWDLYQDINIFWVRTKLKIKLIKLRCTFLHQYLDLKKNLTTFLKGCWVEWDNLKFSNVYGGMCTAKWVFFICFMTFISTLVYSVIWKQSKDHHHALIGRIPLVGPFNCLNGENILCDANGSNNSINFKRVT